MPPRVEAEPGSARRSLRERLGGMVGSPREESATAGVPDSQPLPAPEPRANSPGESRQETLARLRRLLATVHRDEAQRPPVLRAEEPAPTAVWGPPGLPSGSELPTPFGACYVRALSRDPEHSIGSVWWRPVSPEDAARLGILDAALAHADTPRDVLFLDTETTGLAGGAGTAAFLVGVARASRDGIEMRQFFMRDFDEEAAMLEALRTFAAGASLIVTYNGRAFDLPLLSSRLVLNRFPPFLDAIPHLDLLPAARTLWRPRHGSCRLVHLEARLAGIERGPDVPGALIPRIYFDFLRGLDGGGLRQVFEHNLQDVASLMALTRAALDTVHGALGDSPPDERLGEALALGQMLVRRQEWQLAEVALSRALVRGKETGRDDDALGWARVSYARLLRRTGRHAEAAALLEEAIPPAGPITAPILAEIEELSKVREHVLKQMDDALALVQRTLVALEEGATGLSEEERREACERLAARRHRLECRVRGERWY